MSSKAKTLFTDQSHTTLYKQYRAEYPNALIERIINYLKEKNNGLLEFAIDVGCGSGQATKLLTKYFERVNGYDVSENQLENAKHLENEHKNLKFYKSPSENLNLPDESVDLCMVATALHWFNLDEFFIELKRVLKPTGVFAAFSYYVESIKCDDKELSMKLSEKLLQVCSYLKPYVPPPGWDHLITQYDDIHPPFDDLERDKKTFKIVEKSSVDILANKIRTWSGYNIYIKQNPESNYLENFKQELRQMLHEANVKEDEIVTETQLFLILCRKS